jgi:hypothetical protein
VSSKGLDAEQRGSQENAKERMKETKRETHASRPEICQKREEKAHKIICGAAGKWPTVLKHDPCTSSISFSFSLPFLIHSLIPCTYSLNIMIEVICNDRLGKKVRVKCEYVTTASISLQRQDQDQQQD